mgnify:FL=1|jgi:regulator of RNase E activity RraA
MGIEINTMPDPLDEDLRELAGAVEVPTLGHYLTKGFCGCEIRRIAGTRPMIGPAVTLSMPPGDSTLLHYTADQVRPGDVVVISHGEDYRSAPVGAVLASVLAHRGAAGVVIDGVCTDVDALMAVGLPVYARGTSALTTKLLGLDEGGVNVPITCAGVDVEPGMVVLGDANGVLCVDREELRILLPEAITDDSEEPALIDALTRGSARLGQECGANELLRGLGAIV